jgi:hypothetical protein
MARTPSKASFASSRSRAVDPNHVCVPHAEGKAVAEDDELLEDETEGTTRADAEAAT